MSKARPPADDPYRRFIASMTIRFDQWHDGEGYDLQALAKCTDPQRAAILKSLATRLQSGSDEWRDIEALEAIGGSAAIDAIRAVTAPGPAPAPGLAPTPAPGGNSAKTRLYAAQALARMEQPAGENQLERHVLEALNDAQPMDSISAALDAAAECPTPKVKARLLELALDGDSRELRVNAAGLVLYLAGKAKEPFDWDHRPFFLQFGEEDCALRLAAYRQMCERIGVTPARD